MNHILKNDKLTVTTSTAGAELTSIVKDGREYIWQGDPQYWTGHSTNLFPIVGRVKNGKYFYRDKEYTIHSPHGFATISEFEVEEKTDTKIVYVLKANEKTKECYPFDFIYKVTHEIKGNKEIMTYTVINTSKDEELLFCVGAHPGFNMPLAENEKFEDCWLEFAEESAPNEIICDNCFPTGERKMYPLKDGKIIPLRHTLFDNDALMLADMSCRTLSICSKNTSRKVTVNFDRMAYLGIWHASKTEAPYVCIEPWNGLPSPSTGREDFETKPTVMRLAPGKEYSTGIEITLE